jgi:hypothetical protein
MSGFDDAPNTDVKALLLYQSLRRLYQALTDVEDLAAIAYHRSTEVTAVSVSAEMHAVFDSLRKAKNGAFCAGQRLTALAQPEEKTP